MVEGTRQFTGVKQRSWTIINPSSIIMDSESAFQHGYDPPVLKKETPPRRRSRGFHKGCTVIWNLRIPGYTPTGSTLGTTWTESRTVDLWKPVTISTVCGWHSSPQTILEDTSRECRLYGRDDTDFALGYSIKILDNAGAQKSCGERLRACCYLNSCSSVPTYIEKVSYEARSFKMMLGGVHRNGAALSSCVSSCAERSQEIWDDWLVFRPWQVSGRPSSRISLKILLKLKKTSRYAHREYDD